MINLSKELIEELTKASRSGGCPDHIFLPLTDCFDLGFTKERLISMGMEWEPKDETQWQEWLSTNCRKVLPDAENLADKI